MKQYIIESASKAQNSQKEFTLFKRITVQVTDPLPDGINLKKILKDVERNIPEHVVSDVDSIYIGNYKMLQDRQADSIYVNGSILITNNQPSEIELYSTFIHEIGHAATEIAKDFIYSDGRLSHEFVSKRKTLFSLLKDDYQINLKDFIDINYNKNFDKLAYQTIGYDNLGIITSGLFISPYAATDLREYFANGFEHLIIDGDSEIRKMCPMLFRKIKELLRGDYAVN